MAVSCITAPQLVIIKMTNTLITGVHVGQEVERVDGQVIIKENTFPIAVSFSGSIVNNFLYKHKISFVS